ncbi:trigger factor [Campylobacter sp. 19-13652]|uniref:trigger factor n=1 Tax=Campylobacter sp. 19-13652 TaxID=2840180 RepID=UPI001C74021A|nr:trigger factor [Campylobacter sp. 19-13652]BCX78649.1 trigger factor [Campylobacter sp. 19-13652]
MQVKATLNDSVNAVATAKIGADEIKASVNKLASKAAKSMKIDGFRKGKVPVAVVLKRYEKELEKDAEQDFFRDVINEAVKELKKSATDVIGEPSFSKFDRSENGLDLEINISFKPSVDVSGYEELIPDFSTPRVLKKDIDEKKEELLKMLAQPEKVEKDSLEKGDFAKFDFEGFIDGVAFDGGKAEKYILEIGSGQFIPGFEDGMLGLKVGEERDVKVTFPADYGAANLAGKEAVFKVKLHEIMQKKVPQKLDEELLKRLIPGEEKPSEELLEERIKEQLKAEKMAKLIAEELKPKLSEALVEKIKFDLPKNIVEQEIDVQFSNAWASLSTEEMDKFRNDPKAVEAKREEYRKDAENSVKLTFIVDELARVRGVSVSDQEVMQAVYFEAYRAGVDPREHIKMYQQRGLLPAIKMSMVEERLFSDIFNKDKKADKAKKEKAE